MAGANEQLISARPATHMRSSASCRWPSSLTHASFRHSIHRSPGRPGGSLAYWNDSRGLACDTELGPVDEVAVDRAFEEGIWSGIVIFSPLGSPSRRRTMTGPKALSDRPYAS